MNEQPALPPTWDAFVTTNQRRRAVRDLDGAVLDDGEVRAVLAEALRAPSSGNLQPYEMHWVRDPDKRAALAAACEGQRAATSASALVVFVARVELARRTAAAQLAHVAASPDLAPRSRAYHQEHLRRFVRFLRLAPLPLWTPLAALARLVSPALTLVPVGPAGVRHWAARSSLYAAQTLLLAASARGLDACPMEGFDARRVARLLDLPRGSVIPIVIALGRRRPDARIEPPWRCPLETMVVVH